MHFVFLLFFYERKKKKYFGIAFASSLKMDKTMCDTKMSISF